MNFTKFSPKQKKVLSWWKDDKTRLMNGIICEGAIRSGKTMCMSLSFVLWAMSTFQNKVFAICGKSVISVRRNISDSLAEMLGELGLTVIQTKNENKITVSWGSVTNYFYLFGGNDESSASLIQGITLAGVFLDEVVLMPESFVNQAVARCSVPGSKLWFNCNPGSPNHWFKKKWIDKAVQKKILCIHFTLDDNLSLSPEIKTRYRKMYTGEFYDRFVLGKWVSCEGRVYSFFNEADYVRPRPKHAEEYVVSVDYGTANPCSMGLWALSDGVWYRVKEYYWDSRKNFRQKTDEEYYADLLELTDGKNIESVVVDPSALSFIECIRSHGKFDVLPAINDVLNGIRKTSDCLKNGKIVITDDCTDLLREIESYVWQEGTVPDSPKKENDHALDDMRYFVSTIVSDEDDFSDAFATVKR